MTNAEAITEILRSVADGMRDLLTTTLKFDDLEHMTKKGWSEATSALRSMDEAVSLLETLAYIEQDLWIQHNGGLESLPPIPRSSMQLYSNNFGNRCYWENVAIQRWLKSGGDSDSESGVADNRWDLDFDVIEETTTETKTTKTTKKKKRDESIPIDALNGV